MSMGMHTGSGSIADTMYSKGLSGHYPTLLRLPSGSAFGSTLSSNRKASLTPLVSTVNRLFPFSVGFS